jgi:hypothetical protein
MMNSDSLLDDFLHGLELGQVLVVLAQNVDGVVKHLFDSLLLIFCCQVILGAY